MSRNFSGTSQSLRVAQAVVATTPLTIACFINPDGTAGRFSGVISIADTTGGADYQLLAINKSDHPTNPNYPFVWTRHNADSKSAHSNFTLTAGTWYHIAGVFAADNDRKIYVDGDEKASDNGVSVPAGLDTTAIADLYHNLPNNYEFDGRIAEAAIWNAALSDDELVALAKGYSPLFIRPQNLVFYVPLIRNNDEDIIGGLSLTAEGAPGIATHSRVIYPTPAFVSGPGIWVPPVGIAILRRRREEC